MVFFLNIGMSLPEALPVGILVWQFVYLCKEKLRLDMLELYDDLIVLFTYILCSITKSCMPRTTANRRNAEGLDLTQNVKTQ